MNCSLFLVFFLLWEWGDLYGASQKIETIHIFPKSSKEKSLPLESVEIDSPNEEMERAYQQLNQHWIAESRNQRVKQEFHRGLESYQSRWFLDGFLIENAYLEGSLMSRIPSLMPKKVKLYQLNTPAYLMGSGVGGVSEMRLMKSQSRRSYSAKGSIHYSVFDKQAQVFTQGQDVLVGFESRNQHQKIRYLDNGATPYLSEDDREAVFDVGEDQSRKLYVMSEQALTQNLSARVFWLGEWIKSDLKGGIYDHDSGVLKQNQHLVYIKPSYQIGKNRLSLGLLYQSLRDRLDYQDSYLLNSQVQRQDQTEELQSVLQYGTTENQRLSWDFSMGYRLRTFERKYQKYHQRSQNLENQLATFGASLYWKIGKGMGLNFSSVTEKELREKSEWQSTPRAVLSYQLTPLTRFFVGAGLVYRRPMFSEEYGSGVSVLPNKDLKHESGTRWLAGLTKEWDWGEHYLFTQFMISHLRAKDLIQLESVSSTHVRYANLGQAMITTWEPRVEYRYRDEGTLGLSYFYWKTLNLDSQDPMVYRKPLPHRPTNRLVIHGEYQLSSLRFRLQATRTGKRYDDVTGLTYLEPYWMTQLSLGYESSDYGDFELVCDNVLNKKTLTLRGVQDKCFFDRPLSGDLEYPSFGRVWELKWKIEL